VAAFQAAVLNGTMAPLLKSIPATGEKEGKRPREDMEEGEEVPMFSVGKADHTEGAKMQEDHMKEERKEHMVVQRALSAVEAVVDGIASGLPREVA
jgi:hypothetical protein